MELQEQYSTFKKLNTEIIAIAQEESDPSTMSRVEEFVKSEFPIVTDSNRVTHKDIKRYGIYLVDKKGIIRTYFEGTKSARPRLDIIFKELEKIERVDIKDPEYVDGKIVTEKPAVTKKTKRNKKSKKEESLDIRWMWSHNIVRAGDDFKLALCPVIADGYHVYSPWDKNMTNFNVELVLPKGIELTEPITYPEAEIEDDPVLKLKLEIYKHVIPLQSIKLKATEELKPGSLTITAKITYQACGGGVCLRPTTLIKKFKLTAAPRNKKRQEVYGWGNW